MSKFNKALNSKIVSFIIACIFLLSDIAYGRVISKKLYLRKPLDFNNPSVTSRYLEAFPELQINSYKRFQDWLGNISQDKLENTVLFLDVLETLLKGLISDPSWVVRKANSEIIKALIDQGLVTKEEVKEKNVLETFLKGLISDPDGDVRKANSETIKALIDQGLVTKEEVIKELKEKNVLEAFLKGLISDPYGDVRKANSSETIKALIDQGLVTKEEVKEKNVLETFLKRFINNPTCY